MIKNPYLVVFRKKIEEEEDFYHRIIKRIDITDSSWFFQAKKSRLREIINLD